MAEERHAHQENYPYHEEHYDGGKLAHEIFAAGYESSAIVHPSSRVDYNYQGNVLIGETVTTRDEDGNVVSTVEYEWYTEKVGNKETRRKVRVQP
jgi:hypothetical protein